MTLSLWPQQDLGPVRRGDIFALGRHRLACIDATDKAAVARLFDGRRPTLVVTSPPYADARDYNDPIPCWDSMMLGALDGHAFAGDVQMLVNLGVVHRKGEWVPYWWKWLHAMRGKKWRLAGQYIWDKLLAIPGQNQGRCRTAHEYIFHFRKVAVLLNETVQNKGAGKLNHGRNLRDPNGAIRKKGGNPKPIRDMRISDSVFRLYAERASDTGHPAVYPAALPRQLIAAYKQNGCITYDPFGGSGTTLLACEDEGVVGLAAELSPAYVQLAIDRWRKMHPDKPVRRLSLQ